LFRLAAVACGGGDDGAADAGGAAGQGSEVTCQQIYDNAAAQCAEGGWPPVGECEGSTIEFDSTGCAAWAAWMTCAANATFTCDALFAECDAHWQGVQQCRAMQAASGCIRLTSVDESCSMPTPFAFACLSGMPSGACVSLETAAAVPYFCCPGQ
jgi:hypothetical protein